MNAENKLKLIELEKKLKANGSKFIINYIFDILSTVVFSVLIGYGWFYIEYIIFEAPFNRALFLALFFTSIVSTFFHMCFRDNSEYINEEISEILSKLQKLKGGKK